MFQEKNNIGMQILSLFVAIQLFFSCGISEKTIVQNDSCKSQYDRLTKKEVYPFVDEMPVYPGGNIAIIKFFSENFKYPEQDQFQASFQLEFVIDSDGKLIGARIRNKSHTEQTNAESEAIRVLELMPKWEPGKCAGKKVPVLMLLPLKL